MTVLDYITKFLPDSFKVHPAYGEIVRNVYETELKDDKSVFANENFTSLRERAALAIPYQIKDTIERERVLNILELILCIHRQKSHGEDYSNRIAELRKTKMTEEEADLFANPMSWWNA